MQLPEERRRSPVISARATRSCTGRGAKERRRPLSFNPRLRRFNRRRRGEASVDSEEEYTAFMPASTVEQPFSTVMQLRSAEGVADLAEEWKVAGEPALWRDYAFFDPDVLHVTENLLSGKGHADLVFDLKWETDPEARRRMTRYLRHITILSLAEVVGHRDLPAPSSVKWHFSYPISMPDPDDYTRVIEENSLDARDRGDGVQFHTESHAALDYFREVEAAETEMLLVLDVGGGSTDIALETRDKGAMWQHSVRLAGDELMTEFLLHNRGFLEDLRLARVGRGGVFGDDNSRRAFMSPPSDQRSSNTDRNVARAIINSPVFGNAFDDGWLYIVKTDAVKLLKAGAALMMGGLCYFLGKQIKALLGRPIGAPDGDGRVLATEDLATIRLCFGGRGSTLLSRWKDDRTFMALTAYLTAYGDTDVASEAGSERRERVSPFFSKDMKHEAAKGMLTGRREDRKDFPSVTADLRVVGIGAMLDKKVDATVFIDDLEKTLGDGIKPTVAWDEFGSFIDGVGKHCGFGVNFTDVAQVAITAEGRQAFGNIGRGTGGVEPPFIAMLRKTLQLLYEGKQVEVNWNAPDGQ